MDKLQNAIVIFGLENGQYTLNDIKQAYRKLASANHPDKGGSTYLALRINEAKDFLIKDLKNNK